MTAPSSTTVNAPSGAPSSAARSAPQPTARSLGRQLVKVGNAYRLDGLSAEEEAHIDTALQSLLVELQPVATLAARSPCGTPVPVTSRSWRRLLLALGPALRVLLNRPGVVQASERCSGEAKSTGHGEVADVLR